MYLIREYITIADLRLQLVPIYLPSGLNRRVRNEYGKIVLEENSIGYLFLMVVVILFIYFFVTGKRCNKELDKSQKIK